MWPLKQAAKLNFLFSLRVWWQCNLLNQLMASLIINNSTAELNTLTDIYFYCVSASSSYYAQKRRIFVRNFGKFNFSPPGKLIKRNTPPKKKPNGRRLRPPTIFLPTRSGLSFELSLAGNISSADKKLILHCECMNSTDYNREFNHQGWISGSWR